MAAASNSPTNPIAAARSDLGRGDGIAAEMHLRQALSAGATEADIAAYMGEAMILQGERFKARQWLTSKPFSPSSAVQGWRNRGWLERLDGNLPAAGTAYDQGLKLAPNDAALWADIARLRWAGGEEVQAHQAIELAVKNDPDNAQALTFRAQLTRESSGMQASLHWYQEALRIRPHDLDILADYAATLGEVGRNKHMLSATRKMLEIDPKSPTAFYLQAVMAARAGMDDMARNLLYRTRDTSRELPGAILLQAVLELKANNPNVAIDLLTRLNRLQPDNMRVRLLLARAIYLAGDYQRLVDQFGAEAAHPAASSYLLTLMARAQEELGHRDLAAPLLDRAAAGPALISPMFHPDEAGITAGRWHDNPGKLLIAVPYIRKLLVQNPVAAITIAEQLRSANPGWGAAQALAGDAQLASGHADLALERYLAAAKARNCSDLMLKLATAAKLAGKPDVAKTALQDYLAQNPRDKVIQRALIDG